MTRIRVFATTRDRRNALTWVAVLLVAVVAGYLLLRWQFAALTDPRELRAAILAFGPLAPVAFVALMATQVVVAPLPGQVLGLVGGYVFGALPGTAYSVLGATIGSWVAFMLSRRYGRGYVERVVDEGFLASFDAVAGDHGETALFLAFLIPGLPDDAICFVAGLTDMQIRRMVAVSVVGRIPGYFFVALAGSGLASQRFVESALLVLALLAVSTVGLLRRRAILKWIGGIHQP